jgi:hypothetical protein
MVNLLNKNMGTTQHVQCLTHRSDHLAVVRSFAALHHALHYKLPNSLVKPFLLQRTKQSNNMVLIRFIHLALCPRGGGAFVALRHHAADTEALAEPGSGW